MEVPSTPPTLPKDPPPNPPPLRLPPSPAETVEEAPEPRYQIHEVSQLSIHTDKTVGPNLESSRPYPLPLRSKQNKVLVEDLKTPDSHVERDPRLIRLTGIHPFNVEAPLSDLFNEGFLTTENLHYVRNHGSVPRVGDADAMDWEFSLEGLVERPAKMTLRKLLRDYDQVTYPITLVCAGNRRKEQNVVRKTKGFSWGAAGLSTALWTGVALGDLLARAVPKRGARYVCFEGADKLPNGSYATSVKLNWAMDPNRGIMVAHKMNGEALHPDHGKPLRIVVPGQIGGRSVKWLRRIIVSSLPSDNWYHIYDNRVLPTMVTPEASVNLPKTWADERYAIYDLNTNSAICYPAHDEKFAVSEASSVYKARGYAYAGGGKRITRVEITLDKGKSWSLANITYPEDEYRLAAEGDILYGGKVDISWREACFCWCFWDLEIPIADLQTSADIMVRAMDDSMMIQPRDMYWSVLGMMNNPWYRLVIHNESGVLRFEHPTQPALIPGGWMERIKKAGGNLTNGFWGEKLSGDDDRVPEVEPTKEIRLTRERVDRIISLDELRKHDGEEAPWFVVNGQVFDGTKFLEGHPGGAVSITGAAGQDVSEEFMTIHSENAKAMMPEYHIGRLDAASLAALSSSSSNSNDSSASEPRAAFLQPKSWSRATLVSKHPVSSDTKIFTFTLDHVEQAVGLPIGQHLLMRLRSSPPLHLSSSAASPSTSLPSSSSSSSSSAAAAAAAATTTTNSEAIIRAYTPISDPNTHDGTLRVLVKIYAADKAALRPGGRMTQALDALPLGEPVDFKGPVGKFEYVGRGVCRVSGRERRVRRFVMVCAGSGITPIFQVLRAVLGDGADETFCLVLDGNRVEDDILCREELDAMAAGAGGKRCRLVYSLSKPGPDWTGRRGRMDRALFNQEVGRCRNGEDGCHDLVLVCGPEALEKSLKTIFADMGWPDEDVLFF